VPALIPDHICKLFLTSYQARFIRSTARYVALIAGRGSGKTWAGAIRLLHRAGTEPGDYGVIAPTYRMLEDVCWEACLQLAYRLQIDAYPNLRRMTISCGQSTLYFRSSDRPALLRGLNLSGVWIDEAAEVDLEAWKVIEPAVRIGTKPWFAFTTTPKGTSHWTYDLLGPASVHPDREVIRASTRQNPFVAEEAKEALYANYSGVWAQQELEGEWVDPEGVEWGAEFWGDWVLVPQDQIPISRSNHRVIAIDPALGRHPDKGDYSAIVALTQVDGLYWVEADIARRSTHQLLQDIRVLADRWKPHAIGFEAVAFQVLLAEQFERLMPRQSCHLYAVPSNLPKELRIRRLTPVITRRQLRIADTPGGRLLYQQLRNWPMDEHDDGPDALEQAFQLFSGVYECVPWN